MYFPAFKNISAFHIWSSDFPKACPSGPGQYTLTCSCAQTHQTHPSSWRIRQRKKRKGGETAKGNGAELLSHVAAERISFVRYKFAVINRPSLSTDGLMWNQSPYCSAAEQTSDPAVHANRRDSQRSPLLPLCFLCWLYHSQKRHTDAHAHPHTPTLTHMCAYVHTKTPKYSMLAIKDTAQ